MSSFFILGLRRLLSAMLLLCALGASGGAVAHDDHDLARQALESGQVLPLATVLGKLAHEAPGQVLRVEFEREDGRFIYEIRLLQNDGRVAKLKVDAVDGRVLAIKRKDTEKDRDANSRGGR